MENMIHMVIDDREHSNGVVTALSNMKNVDIIIKRLSVGDYQVDDCLLFERKTMEDFSVSVIDGRFFKQMTQLATSRFKGVLILEGSSKNLARVGVRREALQGALVTASLILGIPVLRAMVPDETARLMVYAARQTNIAVEGGLKRAGYRPKGKYHRQLYILQGLPGVGPKRAALLLEQFGSIQGIFNASVEKLSTVSGIGLNTAEKIRWSVSEAIADYGNDDQWLLDL